MMIMTTRTFFSWFIVICAFWLTSFSSVPVHAQLKGTISTADF